MGHKASLTAAFFLLNQWVWAQVFEVNAYGYDRCIEINNGMARVVIDPNAGGRILAYSVDGKNIIHEDPQQNGWTWTGTNTPPNKHLAGGRFDIGPVKFRLSNRLHWYGPWDYETTGNHKVKLTSQQDTTNGVLIERTITLADTGTRLTITQKIINLSGEKKRFAHWSRTFVKGGGIAIMQINPYSKYPKGYAIYGENRTVYFNPDEEDNIQVSNGLLIVKGPFSRKKIDMDLAVGKAGYFSTNDLYFTKTFEVFSDKVYGDITGANFSLWYNKDKMVEIEPIGPWEWIEPGKFISFSETWELHEVKFPSPNNFDALKKYFEKY